MEVSMGKIWKSLIMLCAIFCGATESFALPGDVIPSDISVLPDEYRIYETIISSIVPENSDWQIVIEESSAHQSSLNDFSDKTLTFVNSKIPSIKSETLKNFSSKNGKIVKVSKNFNLKNPYLIIPNDEIENIFHGFFGGWKNFYRKYPKAYGLFSLSRVGFNSGQEEAVVYVAIKSDGRSGNGTFYYLTKKQNKWVILQSVLVWIA
jgi:hypothetical protein